jgi:uncharacterized protein (DUF2147 family)
LLFSAVSAFAGDVSPLGYWKTIDDVTNKPKSIIQIWEGDNHALMGKVMKIYPRPGKDQHELCSACEGERHNQPIVGMVILTGLTFSDGQWSGGRILDPANGKTYKCIIKPYADGKRLLVRGYIGLPLLGRSQTWERVERVSSPQTV